MKPMLLAAEFEDPLLNLTLEVFVRAARDLLADRLVSVVLHGSACFHDLAPGYGDLDFLAVVEGDLTEADVRELLDLRLTLRNGRWGTYAHMLEGAFLPRAMLDPATPGKALWWGTTGERPWERNQLGWLVLHVIRESGLVVWGQDIRREIPPARPADLHADIWAFCRSLREHGRPGELKSIDWLLSAARLLMFLREGRLSGKTDAARWGSRHVESRWAERLPSAMRLRLKPEQTTIEYWQGWLNELGPDIRAAGEDLERELAARGFRPPAG